MMKLFNFFVILLLGVMFQSIIYSENQLISEINIQGNKTVQTEAILPMLKLIVNSKFDSFVLQNDIKELYKTGFFDDVKVEQFINNNKIILNFILIEKPVISSIEFTGMDVVKSDSVKDKLTVKQYTIVNEKKINVDLRMIEQEYINKGYYLAKGSYELKQGNLGEVTLIYKIDESISIYIGRISILGNSYFSTNEVKSKLLTKERSWGSAINGFGYFREEYIANDRMILGIMYQNKGFADVDISVPQSILSTDRSRVSVLYSINEGIQYRIGKIDLKGDLVKTKEEVIDAFNLKEGALYNYSYFRDDVVLLTDIYGDLGYAFAQITPFTKKDPDKRLFSIDWEVKKGEKAYFRSINIEGNTKTRDNVIRRNIKVAEGELYNSSKIEQSKVAIGRLGFVEQNSVNIKKDLDPENKMVDLTVQVKEKNTGQINGQVGGSYSEEIKAITFTGQFGYKEDNFLGRGWGIDLSLNVSTPDGDHLGGGFKAGISEPSLFDGPWNVSTSLAYDLNYVSVSNTKEFLPTKTLSYSIGVGRELFEDLRLQFGYLFEKKEVLNIDPMLAFLELYGYSEKISTGLYYDKTNNYLTPTSGFSVSLSQTMSLKLLVGEHYFAKTSMSFAKYIPLNIGEDFFESNFRIAFEPAYIYPLMGNAVPIWERLQLGNIHTMKAYQSNPIGERRYVNTSPFGSSSLQFYTYGGDKRLYGTIEHFIPVMKELGLRFVSFAEFGNVFSENEEISVKNLKMDIGFGFRWVSPMGPLRFEWVFPVENKKIGDVGFVLGMGYDAQSGL